MSPLSSSTLTPSNVVTLSVSAVSQTVSSASAAAAEPDDTGDQGEADNQSAPFQWIFCQQRAQLTSAYGVDEISITADSLK